MLKKAQARWANHPVRMSETRLPTWETLPLDRPGWRHQISQGADVFELNRITEAQRKRQLRMCNFSSISHAQ